MDFEIHDRMLAKKQSCFFQDDDIAVDSGASEGFAGEETHGINRRLGNAGVIMASATGHLQAAIGKDNCDSPLPSSATEFHALPKGTIKRPLLSVGKSCDARLDVWFA